MTRLLAVCLVGLLVLRSTASDGAETVTADLEDLREANRVLEEELKLAARPQIYLVLDLVERAVLIKGRGLQLYRLPVQAWSGLTSSKVLGISRLRARPAVPRPTLAPGEDPAQVVIELDDMPAEYRLVFEPKLVVTVAPPAARQPWLWTKSWVRDWTSRLRVEEPDQAARLRLTLAQDDARTLAWSLVDGMPLIVRHPPRQG